jgi:hypothetical protein
MGDADMPVKYMDRTRNYYRALGYTQDYTWATFDDVPFVQLAKPLSEMRIALITTASPLDFDGVKRVWSDHVSPPPPILFTDNVAWVSTAEQKCIGWPEQKYISEAGRKARRTGGPWFRHQAWIGLSAGVSELAGRGRRLL